MTTIYQCVESDRAYVGYKLRSMSPGNTVSSWLWLARIQIATQTRGKLPQFIHICIGE